MLSLSIRTVPWNGSYNTPCLILVDDQTDIDDSAEFRAPADVTANDNSCGIKTHVSIALFHSRFFSKNNILFNISIYIFDDKKKRN